MLSLSELLNAMSTKISASEVDTFLEICISIIEFGISSTITSFEGTMVNAIEKIELPMDEDSPHFLRQKVSSSILLVIFRKLKLHSNLGNS